MNAGKLRHFITIEQQTGSTPDGMGNTRQVWAALYSNVPADIRPVSSREKYIAERPVSSISHRIYMRYASGITSKMRVKFGTRIFKIAGIIDPNERHISLELDCTEEI